MQGGVAVGEDGVHVQRGAAGGAALEDGEQMLLIVAGDAYEASETSFDNLSKRLQDGCERKEEEMRCTRCRGG